MKTGMKWLAVSAVFLAVMGGGCGGSPQVTGPDELDMAIRDASDYLNDNIPEGSMIVVLNVQSDSAALSDYVIDELIANAVNDKIFKVIDRQQLDLIRAEQNFQLSGEVDDSLALSIGKFFGAHTIVSGRVSRLDARYRLSVRALEVQTARVQGQYNRNMAAGATIAALMRNGGAGGAAQAATARAAQTAGARATASGGGTAASGGSGTAAAGGTAASRAAAEPPPEGALIVNNIASWNTAINRVRNGGNDQTYVIHVTGSVSVPVVDENLFGAVIGLTVTIQGGGTLAISNANGSLLRIGARQTIIARNITLRGRSDNNRAVVQIESGGTFRMEGGALVTGNTGRFYGGGVCVEGGTFAMSGGTISGNTVNGGYFGSTGGGGVWVGDGTFTMSGGAISGNTANGGNSSNGGGGVWVGGGTFTMAGGTISGNTNDGVMGSTGGGVYVNYNGTFTMQGGAISGNTARDSNGGGVYVMNRGTFTKTGGTIHGNDAGQSLGNAAQRQGHALYLSNDRWRNATAGPDDNTDGYGFWMND